MGVCLGLIPRSSTFQLAGVVAAGNEHTEQAEPVSSFVFGRHPEPVEVVAHTSEAGHLVSVVFHVDAPEVGVFERSRDDCPELSMTSRFRPTPGWRPALTASGDRRCSLIR